MLTAPLEGKILNKSKKIFDNTKITDHHAIIPTGVYPQNLSDMERKVYDMVARRFISVFYPDCKFATTTVLGNVEQILFKTTGKQILDPGWKIIYTKEIKNTDEDNDSSQEENVLPLFIKGEEGPHTPELYEKWTTPPRPYTEATLLRAMETAGKFVDNDELRDALKENGIGRPSTRAAIIETLFKRHYIRKEKKNLIATSTGIELIQLIHEELLKSAELTGIWEKKLREIEKKNYDAKTFLEELKQMVSEIVQKVLSDNANRRVSIQQSKNKEKTIQTAPNKPLKKTNTTKSKEVGTDQMIISQAESTLKKQSKNLFNLQATDDLIGKTCPLCKKGTIIKGNNAYGCSEWKNGCPFRINFSKNK
jgi:DNA topoisomerase-3